MKKRISDLLDDYRENSLELNDSTPLSSERIKELTMSKINHKKEKKSKRTLFRVAVAAATISALTLTAAAAEEIFGAGEWFRSVLSIDLQESKDRAERDGLEVTFQETVSEGQVAVVDQLGKVFEEQSFTDQGTTMTLSAAYADANIIHLYLKAEAPEGTVLPDDIIYQFCDWNDPDHHDMLTVAEEAPYDNIYGYSSDCIVPLPDADPTDNKKDFHITIMAQPGQEMRFNDGYSKYLHVDGIYQQVVNVDEDEDGYVLLAPGKFTFDFGMANELEMVELDVDGLTYGGQTIRTWTHDSDCVDLCAEKLTGEMEPETGLPVHSDSWNYSVTAKYLKLSPLSAEWACEFTTDNEQLSLGLGFQVVLKDGTTAALLSDSGTGAYGDRESFGTTYFAVPIDFAEVDYILIGDPEVGSTHKVYLP